MRFDYALMVGILKTATYLKLMEWQATRAERQLVTTGQITVMVQDFALIHKSQLARQHHDRWQQFIIFLVSKASYR